MSEAEIIKIIKEYLSKIYIECTKVGAVGIPNEEWYAIQGLLDLYQKEKEKNKSIEAQRLRDMCYKTDGNYISKDKIKEKIEELQQEIKDEGVDYDWNKNSIISVLQELLEERN